MRDAIDQAKKDNPDLPLGMIMDILHAQRELAAGEHTDYVS